MKRALLVVLLALIPAASASAADRCAKKGTTKRASATQVRVLDESADVDERSLRRRPGGIVWLRGGERRTAPLR